MSETQRLERIATTLRESVITMLNRAKSGHAAGSLGMADLFAALYFKVLHHNPKRPNDPDRDYLFLSNGHICPILYAALAHAGYFPPAELTRLRRIGSRLEGHPHLGALPGVENSSGPLGQGTSQAAGAALALKRERKSNHIYCIVSDGEHDEGQPWEAALFAAHHHLDNLTFIMDRNNIQIDGPTDEVIGLEPLADKYTAFGWHVLQINGNEMRDVVWALSQARRLRSSPTIIIAHTTPGKGVSFMEDDYTWHGKAPSDEQAARALAELERRRSA